MICKFNDLEDNIETYFHQCLHENCGGYQVLRSTELYLYICVSVFAEGDCGDCRVTKLEKN